MNNENKNNTLNEKELHNVSGGFIVDDSRPCPRYNTKDCPGGDEQSIYLKCTYYGTMYCVHGKLGNI